MEKCIHHFAGQPYRRFFRPALGASVRYDRGVGFFSSSWVREAADGLANFACNDGKARWVTSPILDQKDWDALIRGSKSETRSLLDTLIVKNVDIIKNELTRDTLSSLAWMISDGIISFKLACPRNKLSGDFHSKFGLFYDAYGNKLCFSGSYNDSFHGLTNDETISVYPSWNDSLIEYITSYQNRFEKLWNDEDGNVKVYDLPSAAKEKFFNSEDTIDLTHSP